MNILQIGLGGFGKKHIETWHSLGYGGSLFVAELQQELLDARIKPFSLPRERTSNDYQGFLGRCEVVDLVTPATTHFRFLMELLDQGKDIFVEKPMTMNSTEAQEVAKKVEQTKRIVQVGYHYRYHPLTLWLKEMLQSGALGEIRYIKGDFKGFKRPRTDVGVTHTDAIHFFDVMNFLLETTPTTISTTLRDYFPRGSSVRFDDLSLNTLTYAGKYGETLVHIEAGYVQPADLLDPVVPGAMTQKLIELSGTKKSVRVDYERGVVTVYHSYHHSENGAWKALNEGVSSPHIVLKDPVACEFEAFLDCVKTRTLPVANVFESGVVLAKMIEAAYQSARENRMVKLDYTAF